MKKLTVLLLLGGLSQAAAAQGQQKPLEKMDSDGNGSVSFTEFQQREPELLTRADTDKDGFVSLAEFLSQRPRRGGNGDARPESNDEGSGNREQRREKLVARMTEQFQEMDLDGDDLLSTIEFHEANFLRLDRDNNGALDAEELRPPRRSGPRGNKGGRGDKPRRSNDSQ
jgi:Ca2+-binding EF-hand superfamily protein